MSNSEITKMVLISKHVDYLKSVVNAIEFVGRTPMNCTFEPIGNDGYNHPDTIKITLEWQ